MLQCLEKQSFWVVGLRILFIQHGLSLGCWLKNPLYSAWIVPEKVDPLSRSKCCCKDVHVSNMGESALKSHLKR